MKTMMLSDLLALAKTLRKNVMLWAPLALGTMLFAGSAPAIILLVGFPMAHMVLAPMMLRDQNAQWRAFRQTLPLTRADVVIGRYASIAVVVTGCIALGALVYAASFAINAAVPGLPVLAHFTGDFDAAELVAFSAATFALTISMFSVVLPFLFAGNHLKAISYVPAAFMLGVTAWIYVGRDIDFDAFAPFVGQAAALVHTLGGSLAIAACLTAATLALYSLSAWAAVGGYTHRDL